MKPLSPSPWHVGGRRTDRGADAARRERERELCGAQPRQRTAARAAAAGSGPRAVLLAWPTRPGARPSAPEAMRNGRSEPASSLAEGLDGVPVGIGGALEVAA